MPFVIIQHGEATRRCRGTTHHMHEDVEAAETLTHRLHHHGAAFGRRDVGHDKLVCMGELVWP